MQAADAREGPGEERKPHAMCNMLANLTAFQAIWKPLTAGQARDAQARKARQGLEKGKHLRHEVDQRVQLIRNAYADNTPVDTVEFKQALAALYYAGEPAASGAGAPAE